MSCVAVFGAPGYACQCSRDMHLCCNAHVLVHIGLRQPACLQRTTDNGYLRTSRTWMPHRNVCPCEQDPNTCLSQLLAYRKGDYDPTPTLSKLEDVHVRKMVCSVCSSPSPPIFLSHHKIQKQQEAQ
jgi:hypothetical protein